MTQLDVGVTHIMIPTRDGTRLAADLYRAVTDDAVPVVVEYTPYRKDDLRGATRDFGHLYLAARGIASVQLDVRGTGGSEGVVVDEYQYPQEQEDGYDAVEWLARQPWCNGKVGMWGTSPTRALPRCRWRSSGHRRSGRSPRSMPPMTGTRTTCTSAAVR